MDITTVLNLGMILISLALIAVVLLQVRGEGLRAFQGTSLTRTRRGLEKVLFQLTIALAFLFVLVAALNVTANR
ncbi:MAG TPA: preprotein translocase subunit SecG [Dehalococcoidia bacterium]|nr:preprotein translocase subunit SecG [Dehalococcoidia bacterium]